jgi:hypothetical protein
MWTLIAKIAFSTLITAVQKIPPDQWAKLGQIIVAWIQKLQDKLPPGHPMLVKLDAFRATRDAMRSAPPH